MWSEDVLGVGFEQLTLSLGEDSEGPLVATLVRSLPAEPTLWQRITDQHKEFSDVDVLYTHGWSDYFFQTELAHFWTSRGARFYALDLRKYGRSIREGQTHGYIDNLEDYDHEINLAIQTISDRKGRPLIIMGHSTGGLVMSLWATRNPGVASAVILNSPWLEFQFSATVRKILAPLIGIGARIGSLDEAPQVDMGYYSKAQKLVATDEYPYEPNPAWRPELSPAVRMGWIKAIIDAQEALSSGKIMIPVPVCVMLSEHGIAPTRWSESLTRVDSVLNVSAVAEAALQLGPSVTIERIDGAIHDIFLSAKKPRKLAFERLETWTRGFVAVHRARQKNQ